MNGDKGKKEEMESEDELKEEVREGKAGYPGNEGRKERRGS